MRAVVKFAKGKGGVELMMIPKPEPAPGEVLVKIMAAGICASDIHAIKDERETVMPVALGHEFVGEVVSLGTAVSDYKIGDIVTAQPACYSCGECIWCKAGEVTLCADRKSVGSHKNGAMAEYMVCPAKYCFKVPKGDPDKIKYAIAEPLACAVHGIYERLDVKEGDVAVVSGPGTIGLLAAQCLMARGARVVMSGLPADRERMEIGLRLGIEKAVTSGEELASYIRQVAPYGADIAIDCAGAPSSVETCLSVARTHGQVLIMGVFGKPVTLDINTIFLKELQVTAANSSTMSSWDITLSLMASGKVDVRAVLGKELPLSKWEEGFATVMEKTAMKVLLLPQE